MTNCNNLYRTHYHYLKKDTRHSFLFLKSFSFNLPHQPLTAVWCYYFTYKFHLKLELSARQNNRHQAANR
jgi:hypothetical protein